MNIRRLVHFGAAFAAAAFMAAALVLAGCEDPVTGGSGAATCTVSFDAAGGTFNGGGTTQSLTVNTGASVGTLPAAPAKSGYNFGGWYTASSGGSPFTGSTPVTGNITVYAQWTALVQSPVSRTVTFDAAGGTFSGGGTTQTRTVNSGASAGTLPAATKSGYNFGGWYTASSGGSPFTASTIVSADITVYAQWTALNQYTVIFDANGGSGTTPAAQTVNAGTSITLPNDSGFSRTGHTFGGWNTNNAGTGTTYSAGASFTPTSGITLYAQWTAIQYTVTFDADGGSPATQTRAVDYGVSVGDANMPAAPAKSEYNFGGWYTQRNGGGSAFSASTTVSANITVYARWTERNQYTVTFDANGGSGTAPAAQTVYAGSAITLPGGNGFSKTGHTFGGWNTNNAGTGTNYSAGASYTPTSGITLYARWTVIQYTVTFDADGGSPATQTRTVDYGASAGTLPTPAKTGYTFGGWYTARNGSGSAFNASTTVSGSITVYAKWVTQYTVTFDANGGSGTAPAPQTVDYGSVITLPAGDALSKTGHVFGGWNTGAGGTGTTYSAMSQYAPSTNVTLYAKWTAIPYTVTFDADGGSGGTTRTADYGASVDTLPTPAKTGYTFGGWYTARNGGGAQFTASTTVTSAITVYAKWTINQYTVTFDADGGSGGATRTVDYGASAGTLPTATRTGYIFGGWYTARNGGGSEFTTSTTVSANITVYAKWTTNPVGTITAEFTGSRDETITLSGVKDLSWSANTALTVSVSGSYSAYRWALDGAILAGKTASSLTLQGNLSVKQHTLTAVVTKNGVEYTKRVTFTVAQ